MLHRWQESRIDGRDKEDQRCLEFALELKRLLARQAMLSLASQWVMQRRAYASRVLRHPTHLYSRSFGRRILSPHSSPVIKQALEISPSSLSIPLFGVWHMLWIWMKWTLTFSMISSYSLFLASIHWCARGQGSDLFCARRSPLSTATHIITLL